MLDVLLVAALFYQILALLKGTRAAQVLIGMLVIFLAYTLSSLLELETLNWIISKFYSSVIIVVIVLFQDDIRRLLTRFGRGPFVSGLDENSGLRVIEEVVNAAKYLSHDRIGALVVFERGIGLDRLYDHAVRVEALVSEQLLVCIFQSFSPLHDGAVIVQKNRLSCASAQLPLSKNPTFSKKLGTRHSAAVGIAEETDAVVLVVSEETGNISIAWDGQLQKQGNIDAVRRTLISLLMPQSEALGRGRLLSGGVGRAFDSLRRAVTGRRVWAGRGAMAGRRAGGASLSAENAEALRATEYENRLASLGTPSPTLELRFPRYARVKTAKADPAGLVFSELGRDAARERGAVVIRSAAPTGPEDYTASDDAPPEDTVVGTDDGKGDAGGGGPSGYAQNRAAQALSHLSPEDRFVPPVPPSPPPRDVSIGGVSLNPPLDELEAARRRDEAEARKREEEAERKREEAVQGNATGGSQGRTE